ncbi:MAG: hypothetical protein CMJ81_18790 [Planctomycetaceae bacterium]|nr:hypothetical protein [Planctomycetaceae bacterium]MBP61396.1 hypothetical protein [Planctomycetaceae bacterium]
MDVDILHQGRKRAARREVRDRNSWIEEVVCRISGYTCRSNELGFSDQRRREVNSGIEWEDFKTHN